MFTASENKHAVHVLRAAFINMNVNVVCDFLSKFLKQNEHTEKSSSQALQLAVFRRGSDIFQLDKNGYTGMVVMVM